MKNKEELLFFDDFTSPHLDRSKWNVRTTGRVVNDEQQAYIDSPETLYTEKGMLALHPRYQPGFITPEGESFDFTSARIDTREKVEFLYGTAAARIKLPASPGLWPAFWALGSSGVWPDMGEIDIMEYVGEADWTSVALHGPGYHGETPLVNKKYLAPQSEATEWHIYAVEWTAQELNFKIDGELIYRVTRPMVEFYGPWAFDNNKYLILNCALGGIYPFKTNGVEQPYKGIPETTVQLIKGNGARMLVDWVKVTKY